MPKILIVDDDRSITNLLKQLLEMEPDFRVDIALTGNQALKQLDANLPDVIMVDRNLNDMDGITLIAELRQTYPDLPIVMASGMDVQREALNAGADLFILKPFEPSELPDIFLNLLDN